MNKGFLVSATHTGSGKTMITLGLLRHLRDLEHSVSPAKAGPDFIDPTYHTVASGTDCLNLDPWAMSPSRLTNLSTTHGKDSILVVEAMMGLYDGALDATGTPADLARHLGLPIILVLDCTGQSHSVGAIVRGFLTHQQDLNFAGIILNRVGSLRHEHLLRDALKSFDIKILGAIPRQDNLSLPSRHLGLHRAEEIEDLEFFITNAAKVMKESIDIDSLLSLELSPTPSSISSPPVSFPPLGQHIAIARDLAFSFIYPHLLRDWHSSGATLSFFSPLADESPPPDCDAIYLAGGYPELHCPQLSSATNFASSMRKASSSGKFIYGECGGYMVLGNHLIDSEGVKHPMLGLLPITTSFASRKLSLGYRHASLSTPTPFGAKSTTFASHEFHYTTLTESDPSVPPLFSVKDALGNSLGDYGMSLGNTMGSYLHLLDVTP